MSYQLWQDISFCLSEIDQEKASLTKSLITPEGIEGTKGKMTMSLEQLKTTLELKVGKDHGFLILFAIISVIDEEMQGLNYNHLKVRWSPLQKDFYSAYTSGEVFFKTIDETLDNPSIPSMVFEVFYFILKRGFKGKYRDSKTQLSKYLDLLRQRIQVTAHSQSPLVPEIVSPTATHKRLEKRHYYGLAGLLAAAAYLGLLALSNSGH